MAQQPSVDLGLPKKFFPGSLFPASFVALGQKRRDWIRNLNFNLNDLHIISAQNTSIKPSISCTDFSIQKIINSFSDVFEPKIGCIPDYTCALKLIPDAKPIFIKPRTVPYALKSKVEQELDKLGAEGVIEKIDESEWGTPLVVVPKHDGTVRICADFKVTINNQLQNARHPIPRIEDIFNKLRDGKYFCTLDIHKAYLYLKVDEESAKYQTLSTHRGTYLAKRLFFGIKTAPNEFHKFIDQFVQDFYGTIAYFDDIIIQGKDKQDCQQRLIKVFEKLREHNLHLNLNKCRFFEEEVQYLGHVISSAGLHKSSDKIQAISETPRPNSVDDVRKFIGLVMYYSKFIPDASSLLHPLNKLLCKNARFRLTAECESAFIKAKSIITSDQILVPFNPVLPVTLATDASPFGHSGVLSHTMPNGIERPIAFASRSLTVAEKNYSQLDREATAVVWACKTFYDYIFGRKFTLILDNRAICAIFHPEKSLPVMTASRILRYAQFLSSFDYTIIHRKSEKHTNADYLSRNPLPLPVNYVNCIDESQALQQFITNYISTETITANQIQTETELDPDLRKIKYDIVIGNKFDPSITIQDGILFRGNRVIIPKSLQPEMLKQLHSTHIGIVKMKALSRNYCYWKNIDIDIENRECCDVRKNPAKAPLHIWETPEKNWQRVHIDYAGPFMEHQFLIVVDSLSKWPEIFAMKTSPTSSNTMYYLEEIFSRHGLPEILVSDNAVIFKSAEFQHFCKSNGIKQRLIAPSYPATNGQAERYVQILKTKLKCMKYRPGSLHSKLCKLLFRYRITPLNNEKTPSEMLFGRNLRCEFDLIKPTKGQKNNALQPEFNKNFKLGERVQSRNYTSSAKWKYGTVVEKL
nr:uncharacterized protein K02A2.6-like [Parasteatoda tepidariorum]